jgi:catechol 2,3-dioxygenase-like lactoylglutathione lyase family enzyme
MKHFAFALAACLLTAAETAAAKAEEAKSQFSTTTIDLGMVVGDLARSVKFYTDVIGFKEIAPFSVAGPIGADVGLTDGRPLSIRVLVLGDTDTATRLKLMSFPDAKVKPDDNTYIHSQLGFRYLTIYVADKAATLARLKKAGVKPLAKGTIPIPADIAPGLALTVVRDPDGNLIELISPQ